MAPDADHVRYNSQQQRVEWRRGDMLIGWCAAESVETVKAWLQYWGLSPLRPNGRPHLSECLQVAHPLEARVNPGDYPCTCDDWSPDL